MAPDPRTSAFQRTVAFTGRLASVKRDEAFALVRQHGGTPRRGLTRTTSILVVGALGWPLLADGQPARSLHQAKSYGIPIASERGFLEWAGRKGPDQEAKTYSAYQLSSLSALPPDLIEQLDAFGLIGGRDGHYGFRDLTAARQLAELLRSGVGLSTITRSLHEIRKWLPEAELSNLKLYPASSDAILIEHLKGRTDQSGQFVLPVDTPRDDPDLLFDEAQAAEETGDVDTAQRLYRKVMRVDPSDPAAAFNLGNLLRSTGHKIEAEAAYRAATKADPRFAEGWYNLADLLDEDGQGDKARTCLLRALEIEPDYADALFNLGMWHQRRDQLVEAAACWQRYLALDDASDWAARARRALKFCEIQIALQRSA